MPYRKRKQQESDQADDSEDSEEEYVPPSMQAKPVKVEQSEKGESSSAKKQKFCKREVLDILQDFTQHIQTLSEEENVEQIKDELEKANAKLKESMETMEKLRKEHKAEEHKFDTGRRLNWRKRSKSLRMLNQTMLIKLQSLNFN